MPVINSAPIDVDGYIHSVVDQDAENRKKVEIAHEALAQSEAPVAPSPLQNPYPAVQPQQLPAMPEMQIPDIQTPSKYGAGHMLAAATPLLVDFLMGGNQGTAISAGAYADIAKPKTDKDQTSLQIQKLKLAAEQIKAQKALAGASDKPLSKSQVANWNTPNGPKMATYKEAMANGWQLAKDQEAAELLKNSEIGQYWVPGKGNMNVTHSDAMKYGYKPFDPAIDRYNKTIAIDKQADRDVNKMKATAMKMKAEKQIAQMDFKDEKDLYDKRNMDPATRGTIEMAKN